jgi:hypothetical protein
MRYRLPRDFVTFLNDGGSKYSDYYKHRLKTTRSITHHQFPLETFFAVPMDSQEFPSWFLKKLCGNKGVKD